jgi:membrane associated rhomboid family serine protease
MDTPPQGIIVERMASRRTKNPLSEMVEGGKARVYTVGGTTALLWVLESVDFLIFRGGLDQFGVHPHEVRGLWGILFAPFLHAGFGHLIANTVGFVVLGLLVTSRRLADFWLVFWTTALTAGLGCWLFGGMTASNEVHIGVSGVIFGFLGFLMARGWFERRFGSILMSVVVTFFFYGMLFGMVPDADSNISWQAHLFGWLGGLGLAWLMAKFTR